MTLLQDITRFAIRHNLTDADFGEFSVNDRRLVRDMREGKTPNTERHYRILRFMEDYRSPLPALVPPAPAPAPRPVGELVEAASIRAASANLLRLQLETGQYFPAARQAWLARHGAA